MEYSNITDKKLSEKLDLKHSILISIRYRLRENEYFRILALPSLQNLGDKILVATYTNFSPLIPLDKRVKITGETIEVFDEIFFSVSGYFPNRLRPLNTQTQKWFLDEKSIDY